MVISQSSRVHSLFRTKVENFKNNYNAVKSVS